MFQDIIFQGTTTSYFTSFLFWQFSEITDSFEDFKSLKDKNS